MRTKVREVVGESEGTAGKEEQAGVRQPKPFAASYSNGMFQGQDNSLWMYFKMPEDVQVEWTKSYQESADNQSFLTEVFNDMGQALQNHTESTRKDERIKFHIPMARELSNEIAKYPDISPAHADFLDRMVGFSHPVWHSYFGVKLPMGDINSDVYGATNKVRNYVNFMIGNADIEYSLYKESIELFTAICLDNGMRMLDFNEEPEDYERLTAWYGESDSQYGVRREMETTGLAIPEHGKSIFCGGSELTFSAIRPRDSRDMFRQDPFDEMDVRFGKALLRPSLNTVHINIRGEIRAPSVAANVFDNKMTKYEYEAMSNKSSENSSENDRRMITEGSDKAGIAAMQAAKLKFAWLDNVEITTANIVDGKALRLNESLMPYGLEAVNVTKRQHLCLGSTIPGYPNPIFKIPSGNSRRNPNVNNFYAGVLSLSGLFRSTKPCGPKGMLLGLSDSGYEFKEIYSESDAAHRYNKPPLILVSGGTGSGKALSLDTVLPTPYGNTTMGDVEVGDVLFGPDGQPCNVTYTTDVMEDHTVYRMALWDNQTFDADADHQWIVRDNFPAKHNGSYNHMLESAKRDIVKALKKWPKKKISIIDLNSIVRRHGGEKVKWDNWDSLIASLDFVGVTPVRYFVSKMGEELPIYRTKDAIRGLSERINQKKMTVSWREGVSMTRMTTAEIAAWSAQRKQRKYKGNKKMKTGIVRPQFSIYASHPIDFGNNTAVPDIDPYLLGFALTATKKIDGALAPEASWSLDDARVTLKHNSDRAISHFAAAGYDASSGVFGSVRVPEEFHHTVDELMEYQEVPYSIRNASLDDRLAFAQGIVDGQCNYSTAKNMFIVKIANTNIRNSVSSVLRSCGIAVVNAKTSSTLSFYHNTLYAGDSLPSDNGEALMREKAIIPIRDIDLIDSVPVKCIEVDNDYHAYLVGDYIPTSNTIQLLMMSAQVSYMGRQAIFLNPKPDASLKPFFDFLGGVTINLSNQYLDENPGLLDPVFFLDEPDEIGRLLADMIIRAQKMNDVTNAATAAIRSMEELTTELIERARMPANQCSFDIIFGNRRAGTPPLSDDDTLDFIHMKMQTSPFWKAAISNDPEGRSRFEEVFKSGKPLLVEWDNSIVMPNEGTNQDRMTTREMDGVQSVVNLFTYSTSILGRGKRGGILVIDEAHIIKTSEVAMQIVKRSGRYWRESNISLAMASQNMKDYMGGDENDLSAYARMFIIMKVPESDEDELDIFYRITGLPRDKGHTAYITNAGVNKNPNAKQKKSVPNAYLIDRSYDWQGGIICGPWPEREMNAAIQSKLKNATDESYSHDDVEDEMGDLEGSFSDNPVEAAYQQILDEDENAEDV